MDSLPPRQIFICVVDLLFASRIETTARAAGLEVTRLKETDARSDSAAVDSHSFLAQVRSIQPQLVLIDLDEPAFSPLEWIAAIKAETDTRDIPLLCFGSHVRVDRFKAARKAGADQVLARSRFLQSLPDVLSRVASAGIPMDQESEDADG